MAGKLTFRPEAVSEDKGSTAPRVEYIFDIPDRGVHLTDVFPVIVTGQTRIHELASRAHIAQILLQEPTQPLPISLLHAVFPQTDAVDQPVCLSKIVVAPWRIRGAGDGWACGKDRANHADGSQQSDHAGLSRLNVGSAKADDEDSSWPDSQAPTIVINMAGRPGFEARATWVLLTG
jgi:hypothetical protein